MEISAKYGVELTVEFPVIKKDDTDFAATGDWTPATGDTKISKDGGTGANTSNNPAAIGGTGSVLWKLTITATEMQAARVAIQIVDAAIEDQVILVETYGNASAQHAFDLDNAKVTVEAIDSDVITSTAIAADAIGDSEFNAQGLIATAVWDKAQASHVGAGTFGEIATEIASILADTNELQGDWVDAGRLDVLLDAIKAVTDNLPNSGALNDLSAAVAADAVWDEARADHVAAASFGRVAQALLSGTAAAGASNQINIGTAADVYIGNIIQIVGGTGSGQSRNIIADSGDIALVSPDWATNPDNTSEFVILPTGPSQVQANSVAFAAVQSAANADAVWDEDQADHVGAGTFGELATEIAAILADTGTDGVVISAATANAIADALLVRAISNVETVSEARSLYGAIAALVNRRRINGANLETMETDDATIVQTLAITEDASQDPIGELNP